MPLSGGTSGAHDDSMHQGSAKRDVAGGIAGLDSSGDVVAPDQSLMLTRNGSDELFIGDRLSGELAFFCHRSGVNNYYAGVKSSGAFSRVQLASMKDVASGIAALDAAGSLLLPGSKMYYTRDGSDDVHIYERTSNEEAYAFHRVGADDYTFFVKESNVWKRMQTESMKDAANGIAGLDGFVEVPGNLLPLPMLTDSEFQTNAGTGTADNPARLNDNLIVDSVEYDVIGEYVEVQFAYSMFISKYRQHGTTGNTGDGSFRIQHWDGSGWVDNSGVISTRNTADWSDWAQLTRPVYTSAIRLVALSIDTNINISFIRELQVQG